MLLCTPSPQRCALTPVPLIVRPLEPMEILVAPFLVERDDCGDDKHGVSLWNQ